MKTAKLRQVRPVTTQAVANPTTTGASTEVMDAFCFLNNNGTVYDLNDLNNEKADYKLVTTNGGVLDFNVCDNALTSCPNKTGLASFSLDNHGTNCVLVAGPATVSSKFFIIKDAARNLTTVRMQLPEGDQCKTNKTRNYQTTIDVQCDANVETPQIVSKIFDANSCDNTIVMKSKNACPQFNVYALWNGIMSNKYLFGTIVTLAGIFLCFFGRWSLKITEILAGAAVVLIIFLYLIFNYVPIEFNTWQFWLVVVIAIILGCVAGWFISKLTWLPPAIFGGLLGFVGGMFLYNLLLKWIKSNPIVVFWITMVICVIAGVVIGIWLAKPIIVISTAVCGSYAIIRGLSFMIGHFPDERQVYELMQKKEWSQLEKIMTGYIYIYLAFFVILAALGMFVQFKYFYGDEEKDEKKEDKPTGDEDKKLNEEAS